MAGPLVNCHTVLKPEISVVRGRQKYVCLKDVPVKGARGEGPGGLWAPVVFQNSFTFI